MLILAGIESNRDRAIKLLETKLNDGSAWEKFREMVKYQGGDLSTLLDKDHAPQAPIMVFHKAKQDGYLQAYSTYDIGRLVIKLGGGRQTKEDVIDPLVGFKFYKKIGDKVHNGEIIAEIHANDQTAAKAIDKNLDMYIKIGSEKPAILEPIKDRLS
jgi:pyrimidine-nucleoside phosphorylase